MLQDVTEKDKISMLKELFGGYIDIEPTDSYTAIMRKIMETDRLYNMPWGFDVETFQDDAEMDVTIQFGSCTIDWGDGTTTEVNDAENTTISHTYKKEGKYKLRQYNRVEGYWQPIPAEYSFGGNTDAFIKIVQPYWAPQSYVGDRSAVYTAVRSLGELNHTEMCVVPNESLGDFDFKGTEIVKWNIGDNTLPVNDSIHKQDLDYIPISFANSAQFITIQLKGELGLEADESVKFDNLLQLTVYPDFEVFKQALTIFTNHTAKVEGSKLTILKGSQQQKCYDYAVANYSEAFDVIEMQ